MIDHAKTHYVAPCGHEVQKLDESGMVDLATSIDLLIEHVSTCADCAKVDSGNG